MSADQIRQALRPAAGGLIAFRIADEIARLKSGGEWRNGDRHAVSLVKDDAMNVLLMALKKGARLHPHRVKGPIVLQVLSGSAVFTANSDERVITAGEILGLDRQVTHGLEALEECALLVITAIE